jgi:hypothetical protein
MRIFIVLRGDDNIGFCPVVDTARITEAEAEAYVAEQESLALGCGDEASYWTIVDVDLPLRQESPRVVAEAATQ